MIVTPQPVVIRKKIGTSVRPRPRNREQSIQSTQKTITTATMAITDSIENTSYSPLRADTPQKKLHSHAMTIEEYIHHKPQPDFHKTLPASVLSGVATSKAVDDAYDYLFKDLKGQCHGLNVVTYPRLAKDGDNAEQLGVTDGIDRAAVNRFAILAYIQPGTMYHNWEEIEEGLARIFKEAAAKQTDSKDPEWHLEGVVFELWESKPASWDQGSYLLEFSSMFPVDSDS